MRLDKVILTVFMALALLVLLSVLIFSSLKTSNINVRLTPRNRAAEVAAANQARLDQIKAESQARIDEMRAETQRQMAQAYAQSLVTEAQARADALTRQAGADAMLTRSMAILPWILVLLVGLIIVARLFLRPPTSASPAQQRVVLVLPPGGADRQYLREVITELRPDQVYRLPERVSDGAIVPRESHR